MSEVEGTVVVNGDDDIRIVRREFQFVEGCDVIPLAGADDDRPFGVSAADQSQGLSRPLIPQFGSHSGVGFIEQLEKDLRRAVLLPFGDHLPAGHVTVLKLVGISTDGREFVKVQYHEEAGL